MLADLGESISVVSSFDSKTGLVSIHKIVWRSREYVIDRVGLHHRFWKGRVLTHIFSVVAGNNYLKLRLETDSLSWFIDNFISE